MKKIKSFKIRSERVNLIIKWFCYFLLAGVSYLYMTSLSGGDAKALLFIPLALCISMRENEMASSLTGVVCGLMMDSACGKVFGYNAFILMIICMFTSLLFLYLMRQNIINLILITFGGTLIHGLLDFSFYYAIWGYDNVGMIFWHEILPGMIFTIISSIPLYLLVKFISKKFSKYEYVEIEEKSDRIVRE